MNLRRNFQFKVGILLTLAVIVLFASCAPRPAGEMGTEIIEARDLSRYLSQPNAVLVDARNMPDYRESHIQGAVNVSRADIVVMNPFPALLAPAEQIERVMGSRGISNDSLVLIYDNNNNMDAARLWWTLKVYGHDNVKVVSGGFQALLAAGFQLSTTPSQIQPAVFRAGPKREDMLVTAAEIRRNINEPNQSIVLLDTRSDDEWSEGFIPGAIHANYIGNNFRDGTFRPVTHIRIRYLELGVDYTKEVHLYCLTSIRATQTFLAMYNAGYRNLRLYDGAWVEWSANPMNPIAVPEVPAGGLRRADQS
jgi:thiosulfate/3-mercaptopyruvate sulfurtransferase